MEAYAGQQFVGIDLHRRRSVMVRMDAAGGVLEKVQILNDADRLTSVIARAGESPEVVLEATYGWYWAADALAAAGTRVHLAHPLGVKAFEHRRVKNDERDATDLADPLRMGRCRRRGSRPRRSGNCGNWSGTAPSSSGCAATARPKSTRCWPPFVLGHDAAGVVTRVGSVVRDFQVGDEVYARPRDLRIGTFAEYIAIDQDDVARKPDSLTLQEAAAVPLVSLAAWQALVDRAT